MRFAKILKPRLVLDHLWNRQKPIYLTNELEFPLLTSRLLRKSVEAIDTSIEIDAIADRFRPRLKAGQAVFVCVDSIAARTAIWRSLGERIEFWTDGRMLGEVIRVLAVNDAATAAHYRSTLFDPSEAQQGACTSRSTIYAASIAAALMVHQFTRWLREIPVDSDTSINLLAGEWTVHDCEPAHSSGV